MYPGKDITNIVEYSHVSHVDRWCKEDGSSCKHTFTVRPYRCIEGEFVTESLQVPSGCQFGHVAGRAKCNGYKHWNLKAEQECAVKIEEGTHQGMKLRSFAILEPCGLDMFRGVEYVCCPKSVEEKLEKVVDLDSDKTTDDDEYDDEDDEDDIADDESSDNNEEQDPYFKEDATANEHERFKDAEERLERKHRKKVTKVITEWSELFERYNKMKEKDPKGAEEYKREMTARFRKTVAALEEENKEQRKQIEEVHDERVQAALNEKKRQATHEYRAALAVQVGNSNKNNILKTLKNYIRAEEKDRTHMLNRYRHLLRSDPEEATAFEPVLLHRLRYIDLRINGTLAMLRDFPDLESQIKPIAVEFWHEYRRENTPEMTDEELTSLGGDEKNEKLIKLYKQTYERNHPSGARALPITPSTTVAPAKAATTTEEQHFVALKDVLSETKEDSDEDQFEEDDEDEEEDKPKTAEAKKPASEKHPFKLPIDVAITQQEKELKKVRDELEIKPAKTLFHDVKEEEEPKKAEKSTATEDEDDYDEDEEEDSEKSGDNERELQIAIEPIVSAPIRVHEDLPAPPSYAKHDLLLADDREPHETVSVISGQGLLATAFVVCFAVVVIVAVTYNRFLRRHPGFVEVDVCTPEERHVAGLQVNGYENPTYFFDSKP
ncbi:Amyloid A4 extracellular domain containing protein [Aphelenchoides avenae]|nr:Amyloid A4 extracellular domain containing protein [Aphelenchus avenae]